MLSDFRFACRSLARNRTFTLVMVLTLALGIGSAASIFSVTEWILFRARNFPDDLYVIGGRSAQGSFIPVRFDFMLRAYTEQTNVLASHCKAAYMAGNVVIRGQPVATGWLGVSPEFFPMLNVTPALGRGFLAGEDVEGSDHVVVVSHQFWQQQFGGQPDILGRKITVGDSVCTVVGVLREGQMFPPYFFNDVFRPLTYRVNPAQPWSPALFMLARLNPGITSDQAAQALGTAKLDLAANLRAYYADDHPALSSLTEVSKLFRKEIYWVMLGAVGFLYAIACLNASNLMLLRMLGQRRELSIRLALGGGRWRIIQLFTVESVTLAVLASLAGLLVANWLFPLLLSAAGNPGSAARDWTSWTLGWRVVGVLGLLTVITSLLICVVPAMHILRADISSGLKDGGAALGESRALARLRSSFVVLQAMFAVILLSGAGLMIHTFQQLQRVDLGFDPARKAKVQIGFPADYPSDWEPRLNRLREIQAALLRLPGVQAVGFGNDVLLPGYYYTSHTLEGPEGKPIKTAMMGFNIGYQDAAGLTLKCGRWLNQTQGSEILVNESLARAIFPNQNPLGQVVRAARGTPGWTAEHHGWTIVGVVGDIRASMREAPGNYIYSPEGWGSFNFGTYVIRLSRDYDETLAGSIRRNLYAFDPRIVVNQIVPIGQLRDNQLWVEHLTDSVLKVLAGIALLLTIVGIFSVLAYTVDRRMGEFGVRLALGASRWNLVDLVMRRCVILTATGILLGLGGTFSLTRYIQSLLFETPANDPWVLAAVSALLLITSLLACILPARRATKVDITKLLRSE